MILVVLISICMAALSGLGVKALLDWMDIDQEITWGEYGIGVVTIGLVLIPLITYGGWRIARSNNLTFYEYLNGWEKTAITEEITCSRDGPCWHDYDCDPYIVMVPYTVCSGSGKSESCTTYYRAETRYHSCPYVRVETNYIVRTTLGDYMIGPHRFPENPQVHRWREGEYIPDYVIENAGVGAPQFWLDAKARIESHFPGPVTGRHAYDNYILASEQTILKQYSSAVEEYRKRGLLPAFHSGIESFYFAPRAYFVGMNMSNAPAWNSPLAYLNAAFGSERQGNMHLVVVNTRLVQNPDEYVNALHAYWSNRRVFKKNVLSKNDVVVVAGTDGKAILWGRAFTGMPIGNETLMTAVRENMRNMPLSPDAVIGVVRRHTDLRGNIRTEHQQGFLERVLWSKEAGFDRVAMTGKSGKGKGFLYLAGEIELTRGQLIAIWIFNFLASGIVWTVAAFVGERNFRGENEY